MAKEYIERNALLAEYDRVHIDPPGGARKLILQAPTANVVEVVHGKWLMPLSNEPWRKGYFYRCSVCDYINNGHTQKVPLFCEYCGARMDEEGSEKE